MDKKDLAAETLFDRVKPSVAVDVPAYNEPTEVNLRLGEILVYRGLKEYIKEVWRVYEDRKKRVFSSISEEWKLFMAYFKIADLLGHIYIAKDLERLRRVYFTLDGLTRELKSKVSDDDAVFLIVSDHGMKPEPDGTGNHSSHGFYSVNIETSWEPKDVIDFYPKIMEWIATS